MDDTKVKLFNMYFDKAKEPYQEYIDLYGTIDELLAALLTHMSNEDKLEKKVEELYRRLENKDE